MPEANAQPQGGNPGGVPAGGAPAGGSPDGGVPVNGGGVPASGSPAPTWHGMTEAADIAYVDNKGWKSPADVYKSYRGVETLVGRDPSSLFVVPRADDAPGFRAAMSRLGMPETADKYDIPVPEGTDPAYGNWARDTFHKLGLTASQAKQLTEANNTFAASQQVEQQKAYERSVTTDKASLLAEWRGGYERMMSSAQTAVAALGFTGEMVDALEASLGFGGTMKFFAGIGQKLGEDSFVGGERQPGFGAMMTPDEARLDWEKAKLDPNFLSALRDGSHPGHKEAMKKQNDLFKIMYGNEKVV